MNLQKRRRLYFLIIPTIVLVLAIASCFIYFTFFSVENNSAMANIFTIQRRNRTDIFYPSNVYYLAEDGTYKISAQDTRGKQYLYLPSCVDITAVKLFYDNYTGSEVTVERGDGDDQATGVAFKSGLTYDIAGLYDYSIPTNGVYVLKFTYSKDGRQQDEYLNIMVSSDISSMFFNIDESNGSISSMNSDKNNSCTGTAFSVDADSQVSLYGSMSVKGRGNSTWKRDKKPYLLKLNTKRDVLGMGKAKSWVFLANYDDSSLVRNAIAFDLSNMLGFSYTCEYRYVDLYMNGRYYGNYMVCEKIQIDKERLNIYDLEDTIDETLKNFNSTYETDYKYLSDLILNEPDRAYLSSDKKNVTVVIDHDAYVIDLTKGYILEFDYYTDSPQLKFDSIRKITVKSPDNLAPDITNDCFSYITSYLYDANEAILSSTGYNQAGKYYTDYIDLDSFAKMWMAKEYVMDWDACVSMYMYMDSDHKLYSGPLWDNDNAFGMSESIYNNTDIKYNVVLNGGYHNTLDSWLTKLMSHQDFLDRIKSIFSQYSYVFNNNTLSNMASNHIDYLSASADMNFMLWREKYNITSKLYLASFLNRRDNYFNTYIPALEVEKENSESILQDGTYYIESSLNYDSVLQSVTSQNKLGLVISDASFTENQRFYISSVGNGYYNIISLDSGDLLTVESMSHVDGADVLLKASNGSDSQKWQIKYSSTGYFYIISSNGLYLTVQNGNIAPGTNIVVSVGNNTKSQKFRFMK